MLRFRLPVLLVACLLAFVHAPPVLAAPVKILALGDSLMAGYNLAPDLGFAPRLENALAKMGREAFVINGGVSGDTSAGGLARLDWMLAETPDMVILELGANDALRGLDPATTRANLAAIIERLQARHIPVLLAGMKAPRNLGPEYVAAFDGLYPDLAAQYGIALYPFFLEGVALQTEFLQEDGLHPNAAGVDRIVANILPAVIAILDGAP